MIAGTDLSVELGVLGIELDVKLPEGLITDGRFDQLLGRYANDIAGEARDFWISEAGRRLKSSKRRYQDSIVLEGGASASGFTLSLSDPLAIAVELGSQGFDMKPGLMGKVVPMNLDKQEVSTSPTFRTVTRAGGWVHPGWEARNIIDDVATEIVDTIIPKYIQKIIEEL
jgi:hypothetical protein